MTIATIIVLGVVILALVWMLRVERKDAAKALTEQAAAWHKERQELITRVQRPDLVPTREPRPIDPEQLQRLREQQREFNRVGSVMPLADN